MHTLRKLPKASPKRSEKRIIILFNSILAPYEQGCVQNGQKFSHVITLNVKFQNPNVKSMSNIKWPNEEKFAPM